MNSINLLKLKNNTNNVLLSETIISTILTYFNQSNIKIFKSNKKPVNILKNNKIQNKKDLNENKLIMIMNKISHNNINELIKEYLLTITVKNEEEYIIIQTEILLKLIKDISFINNYIPFIIQVFSIEKHRLSLYPSFFINKLEHIIHYHYTDKIMLNSITNRDIESDRNSCLTIITKLIECNLFKTELYNYITKLLLTQKHYIVDIYYWFNEQKHLIGANKNDIIKTIKYCIENKMHREQLMIESLFCNEYKDILNVVEAQTLKQVVEEQTPKIKTVDPSEVFLISTNNIIEEFLYLEYVDEVVNFLNLECKELNNKNIFCKELLKYYIECNDKPDLILDLFNTLIQNKTLFKSNLSKSLQLYLDNNDISNKQFITNIEKFLHFLKKNNITKNIEYIFKKYKVKLNY